MNETSNETSTETSTSNADASNEDTAGQTERLFVFVIFALCLYAVLHLVAIVIHDHKVQSDQCGFKKYRLFIVLVWIATFWAMCVVLAILASPSATCDHGVLWEYHAVFWVALVLGKLLELIIYQYSPEGRISIGMLLVKLNLGTLSAIDTYTDIMFIVNVRACPNHQWIWVLSTVTLIFGVVVAQYTCGPILAHGPQQVMKVVMKLSHFESAADLGLVDAQYEYTLTKATQVDPLIERLEKLRGEKQQQDLHQRELLRERRLCQYLREMFKEASLKRRRDISRLQREIWAYKFRASAGPKVAFFRCAFEDAIQAAIQITFLVVEERASPQVIASIVAGFLSSCASVAYSCWAP